MNKAKILLSTIIIIWWMLPFISFWQSCPACWSSPLHVTLINSFTTEMLWTIKTIWSEAPYAGKYVPPSRFDSGKFIAPKQSLLSKTTRRARETLWSALAIRRIHLEFSDLANIWDSLAVMARNKTIIRDRQKVWRIEQDINKKKYELSVWWWRTDKIWWINLETMKEIIERYKWLWVLWESTNIANWAEYWDLIMLLWRTNSSLKHLVALGWEDRSKITKTIPFQWTNGKISIQIKEEAIQQIKENYDCTKKYACEDSRWSIQEEIKKIWEIYKNWRNNASTEFKSANQRLVQAYSKENLKKVITENPIFNQLSGAINEVKDRRNRAKYEKIKIDEIKDEEIKNEENDKKWTTWDTKKTITDIKNEFPLAISSEKQNIVNNFQDNFNKTIETIQTEKNQMKNKYSTLDTPYDILSKFVLLSERINNINNKIIWSKDWIDNCLIKNLWLLCEKQCSNILNKKCYY